jgi:hypothetical protein
VAMENPPLVDYFQGVSKPAMFDHSSLSLVIKVHHLRAEHLILVKSVK